MPFANVLKNYMENKFIIIEVAYATKQVQRIISLQIEAGSSIAAAIKKSGILECFPEINLHQHAVGVFSELKQLGDTLKEGDRIEIYRPLITDPKEARRKRVRQLKKNP